VWGFCIRQDHVREEASDRRVREEVRACAPGPRPAPFAPRGARSAPHQLRRALPLSARLPVSRSHDRRGGAPAGLYDQPRQAALLLLGHGRAGEVWRPARWVLHPRPVRHNHVRRDLAADVQERPDLAPRPVPVRRMRAGDTPRAQPRSRSRPALSGCAAQGVRKHPHRPLRQQGGREESASEAEAGHLPQARPRRLSFPVARSNTQSGPCSRPPWRSQWGEACARARAQEEEPAVPRDLREEQLQLREAVPVPGAEAGRVRARARRARSVSALHSKLEGAGGRAGVQKLEGSS